MSSLGKKNRRQAAMQAFREGRGGGLADLELPNEDDVYDVVEENDYQQLVESRRQREDFVVNDDGLGYYDDGEELMGDEAAVGEKRKASKKTNDLSIAALKRARKQRRSREEEAPAEDDQQNSMWKFVKRGIKATSTSTGTGAMTSNTKVELDSLLETLDEDVGPVSASRNQRRRPKSRHTRHSYGPRHSRAPKSAPKQREDVAQDLDDDYDNDMAFANEDDGDFETVTQETPSKSEETPTKKEEKGVKGDDRADSVASSSKVLAEEVTSSAMVDTTTITDGEKDEVVDVPQTQTRRRIGRSGLGQLSKAAAKAAAAKTAAATASKQPTETKLVTSIDTSKTEGIATAAAAAAAAAKFESVVKKDEESSYVDMFWIDACDVNGNIMMFGKLKTDDNRFVSGCVMVRNNLRQLFVLPRSDSSMLEVHGDMKQILQKVIPSREGSSWKGKVVKRSYAFDDPSLPRETTDYLKVAYQSVYRVPDPEVCQTGTEHIARILGAGASNLENFLIKRKLMGPGWIRIRRPSAASSKRTWCAIECEVETPKDITRITQDAPPAPPVVTVSLKLKTIVNPKTHKSEVIAAAALCHSNVLLDTATPEGGKDLTQISLLRPLQGQPFPRGFVSPAQLQVMPNERALLCRLVQQIGVWDPDVIVGHHVWGHDLPILFTRCVDLKVSWWSKMGRRRQQPTRLNFASSEWTVAEALMGRLVCDTYLSAKEFLHSETSYGLSALAQTQFQIDREEILPMDIPAYLTTSEHIAVLASHTLQDVSLVQRLLFQLNLLPLTKQLTNVAGNLWSSTLKSNRANRTEFLLLHEFHARKYLPPEKRKSSSSSKSKYAGGLVLDPKSGFYDSFILLLDFNSLYPSLIQEYNLCFTTLTNWASCESETNLTIPEESVEQGVLPRVISTLVQRRRNVKKLMRSEGNPEKKKELDIRQQALKLTANSMYGCLGFSNSRFFAQPIAATVTRLGRETLQRTVDIATEKLGLEVIYGDTDSIMINTRITDPTQYPQVRRLGEQVKAQVNRLYQTLELEIDGTFRSMLLLKKKKYAAITAEPRGDSLIYGKEMKGLDLVRRDWCIQSKDTGRFVLDQILNAENDRDSVVIQIHKHLHELSQTMRDGKLPLEKYVITKGLSKHPKDYPDAKSQPHVHVAKQLLQQNRPVHTGDHIPYIICTTPEDRSPVERAHHPDDVERHNLQPDVEWYLTQQILPPTARLCEPMEGTSIALIAEQLGLDAKKYQQQSILSNGNELNDEDLVDYVPNSLKPPSERFKNVMQPLNFVCQACGVASSLPLKNALSCPNPDCESPHLWGHGSHLTLLARLSNAIQRNIHISIQKYYRTPNVCDDPACSLVSKQVSVAGPICLAPGSCSGRIRSQISEAQLHQQLEYLSHLFCTKEGKIPKGDQVVLQELQAVTTHHLQRSGFHWIEPNLWQSWFCKQ